MASFSSGGMREISANITGNAAQTRRRRLERMEQIIHPVASQKLPLRVIVCSGPRRDMTKLNSTPSRVCTRMLDPEPWSVVSYNADTRKMRLG